LTEKAQPANHFGGPARTGARRCGADAPVSTHETIESTSTLDSFIAAPGMTGHKGGPGRQRSLDASGRLQYIPRSSNAEAPSPAGRVTLTCPHFPALA
jgi:hypothetical protein